MTFNFNEEKRKLVSQLESLEKISIAYNTLKEYLKKVSVRDVLDQYVAGEVSKIEKAANKFGIEFKIDRAELISLFLKDVVPVKKELPFAVPENTVVYDVHGHAWRYTDSVWVEEQWDSSWESSAVC